MIQKPQPAGQRTRGQLLALGVIWCASLAIVTMSSGCSYSTGSLSSNGFSCCEDLDHRLAARRAWARHYAKCYRGHRASRDVRAGFVYGWVKACTGGNTCPPLFAPESCGIIGGRDRNSAAWFQGFPLGVIAAESCGGCVKGTLVNPEFLGCNNQPSCNPGCIPCGPVDPCGAGADPAMMAPEYIDGEQWSEPAPIYEEHQHPHGEPAIPAGEPAAPQPVPEPEVDVSDETAAAETTELVPTQELVEAQETAAENGQGVQLAQPIDWDAVEKLESEVSPVQFEDR